MGVVLPLSRRHSGPAQRCLWELDEPRRA